MSFVDWIVQASIYFPSSVIGGALTLLGVRGTLSGQADLQRAEWNRRETAFQNELRAREQAQHETEEKRFIAAMRAVAVEEGRKCGRVVGRPPVVAELVGLADRRQPPMAALPTPKSAGRVEVNEYLEVRGFPRVWALGDRALVPDVKTGGMVTAMVGDE